MSQFDEVLSSELTDAMGEFGIPEQQVARTGVQGAPSDIEKLVQGYLDANGLSVLPPDHVPMPVVDGYEVLTNVLGKAFQQAAIGKGRERHALGPVGFMPWEQQPILANARQVGPGGPANQVMKKAQESVTMSGNKNFKGAKAEALGAIIYAAALYRLYEEMEAVHGDGG